MIDIFRNRLRKYDGVSDSIWANKLQDNESYVDLKNNTVG